MKYWVLGLSILTLLLFQNCGKPSELVYEASTDLNSQESLQSSAVVILNKHCVECHNPENVNGNISDIANVDYLIYSRLVVPGEPELSPIYQQTSQGLMPQLRPSLDEMELEILKLWIVGLAEDPTSPGAPGGGMIEPRFSVLRDRVFTPICANCHNTRNSQQRFNSYAEVMRAVTAGNADNSLLYRAVTVGVPNAGRMPQGGALSSAQIQAIRDWINAGAMDN
ncbi:MAG: hypothetical protein ACAH59_05595 [Pseudobdellovibrionaceae bacterium]